MDMFESPESQALSAKRSRSSSHEQSLYSNIQCRRMYYVLPGSWSTDRVDERLRISILLQLKTLATRRSGETQLYKFMVNAVGVSVAQIPDWGLLLHLCAARERVRGLGLENELSGMLPSIVCRYLLVLCFTNKGKEQREQRVCMGVL